MLAFAMFMSVCGARPRTVVQSQVVVGCLTNS